ncbi:MAG: WG repeat-containing protein, partial [Terriglobales bacterium]
MKHKFAFVLSLCCIAQCGGNLAVHADSEPQGSAGARSETDTEPVNSSTLKRYSFVSKEGRRLDVDCDDVLAFREGLAAVKVNGKWGY